MPFINTRVLDSGLSILSTEVNVLHYCSDEPNTYAEALSLSLGNAASPTVGSPADGTSGGRKVTIAAVIDGVATASGTITAFALVDSTNSRLLAAGPVQISQAVVIADVITSPEFDVGIPGPT